MYTLLRSIIMSGKNTVGELTRKVNMAWANGDISDEQKIALGQMVYQYKNPQTEYPDILQLYEKLKSDLESIKSEQESIKQKLSVLESGSGDITEPENPGIKIPVWEAWDGISQNYQYGDAVSHEEKYWLDTLRDMQNTWEPGSEGIDERYWIEITKEDAEAIVSGKKTANDVDQLMKIIENN